MFGHSKQYIGKQQNHVKADYCFIFGIVELAGFKNHFFDMSKYVSDIEGFIKLFKSFAKMCSEVTIIEAISLNGIPAL